MIIINTTKNLANTNKNTDEIFSSVDCGEFYRQTFSSVYTKGIEVGKEGIKQKPEKYNDM